MRLLAIATACLVSLLGPASAEDDKTPQTTQGLRLVKELPLMGDPGRIHVDGDRLFVEAGRRVVAFDINKGRQVWQSQEVAQPSYPTFEGTHHDAGRVRITNLEPGHALVVPGSKSGTLVAISRKDGRVLWTYEPPDAMYEALRTRVALSNNEAYACFRNRIDTLRLTDGKVMGKAPFDPGHDKYQAPVRIDRTLCLGPLALALDTGKIAWEAARKWSCLLGEPVVASGRVYLTSNHHKNTLFSLDGRSGKEHFRFSPFKSEVPMGILPVPTASQDHLLVTAYDEEGGGTSTLYALDPKTGKERWRLPLPAIVSRQGSIHGDVAYFYSWDQEILVVDCKKRSLRARVKVTLKPAKRTKPGFFAEVEGGQDVASLHALADGVVVLVGAAYPLDPANQMSSSNMDFERKGTSLRIYRHR